MVLDCMCSLSIVPCDKSDVPLAERLALLLKNPVGGFRQRRQSAGHQSQPLSSAHSVFRTESCLPCQCPRPCVRKVSLARKPCFAGWLAGNIAPGSFCLLLLWQTCKQPSRHRSAAASYCSPILLTPWFELENFMGTNQSERDNKDITTHPVWKLCEGIELLKLFKKSILIVELKLLASGGVNHKITRIICCTHFSTSCSTFCTVQQRLHLIFKFQRTFQGWGR